MRKSIRYNHHNCPTCGNSQSKDYPACYHTVVWSNQYGQRISISCQKCSQRTDIKIVSGGVIRLHTREIIKDIPVFLEALSIIKK